MQPYPISRVILQLVQVLGWLSALAGIGLGLWAIKQGDKTGGLVLALGGLLSGGVTHALMAIGLAIFDLVEKQTEANSTQYETLKALRSMVKSRDQSGAQ